MIPRTHGFSLSAPVAIINIRESHGRPYFYIGRKTDGSMHYGNPFSHLPSSAATVHVASRDEACDRHLSWLRKQTDLDVEPERRDWILDNLYLMRGRDLGCYCYPLRCHGTNYLLLLSESR